jgi:hypothetical protein
MKGGRRCAVGEDTTDRSDKGMAGRVTDGLSPQLRGGQPPHTHIHTWPDWTTATVRRRSMGLKRGLWRCKRPVMSVSAVRDGLDGGLLRGTAPGMSTHSCAASGLSLPTA